MSKVIDRLDAEYADRRTRTLYMEKRLEMREFVSEIPFLHIISFSILYC